ncbi:Iron-chelate-transporting ATPase [Lentibacillus sp. JNUCC-1]|uniref:ribosomal protection-like ABC-F family protein n=1 Tax=Lentibacillus sp. JNUCC-1 TaxID=2654513 RepID=UPI0012E991F6|nr:ABC-F family ATP-binding cassette domain-containing protein [Lentibacillus sp. JNUCC-1]MUV39008.1 Iron-chelate-transporting ATPase [Lentibacillus sp. JNUCC-1]
MQLLNINEVTHDINGERLLNIDQLQIRTADRIGVVGKNGSGKTTLMNLLSGEIELQTGFIEKHGSCQLLPQIKNDHAFKSGGEITQSYIDKAVAAKPDILLADEPTANLDTSHIEKLEQQFDRWQGALVIVSHDRTFLDKLCNKIWEIADTKITTYTGNYSAYEAERELALRHKEEAHHAYVQKKKQLERALELKRKKAAQATKNPEAHQARATPYYAKKQKKLYTTANAIQTRIDKLEKVEKVKEEPPLQMSLPNAETLGDRIIIRVNNLEGFAGNKELWKKTTFHINAGNKVGIVGKNGTGKTTFLKQLVQEKEGITVSPAVKMGYFSQNLDILDQEKSILENVKGTSEQDETLIRVVLGRLHFFRDDVFKPVKVLSGGERVKVSFAKIFLSQINTLVLDEPTNFLDIQGVEALESLLEDFPGTVIFASHDRRLLERVAKRLLVIEQQQLSIFEGDYVTYQNEETIEKPDKINTEQMIIDNKITEVLGKLSFESSPELEKEYQELLEQKRNIQLSHEL